VTGTKLSFLAAVTLAGVLYLIGEEIVDLLGPTMGLVLTYAILSVPLYRLQLLSVPMFLTAPLAMAASALVAWLLLPVLRRLLDPCYAVVVSTVFVAVTTGFGPVAMSFLHRFTDEEGPVEPMPVNLPLNAFYLFPWMVIGLTHLLLR
jgi:Na+/glutamate symporter